MTNHAINSKKHVILLESFKVRPTISAIMASALKPFADDLETELTCSICQEIFTQPKTLPCLHNYCSKCIVEWYERSGNKVTKRFDCPMCKARIDVPDGDATKLRSSFYLDSLLQLLHAMRAKSNHEQPGLSECMSCERRSDALVAFCPQCNGMICNECVNSHKTVKQLRLEHQAKMLADFKQENVNSFVKNQMLCNVKFHEKNKLEYYCHEEACKQCICQKCATLYHRHHDMLGIEEAAEQAKQDIRQDMDGVNKLKEKYEEELMQSRLNIARIENDIDLAKQQVDDVVETVVKMARDHRAAMMESLNRILLDQQKANQEEQGEIETVIKQLSEFSLRCQKLLDKSVACEILVSKEDLQKRCQRYLEIPSILSSKQIQRNVTVRYMTKPDVMQSLQNIGNIVQSVTDPFHCSIESLKEVRSGFLNDFVIISRNSEGEECHTDKGSIAVRIKDGDGNEVVEKTICDERNGNYSVSYRAEKAVPYEILVNIAGQPIKNSPQKVNTLDIKAEFEYVKTFWGVEEREEGALKKVLENEDNDDKKLLSLFKSISLSDVNKEIAVNDFHNQCVQISSLEGGYLRRFSTLCPGTGEGKQVFPTAVVFNDDKIIVCLFSDDDDEGSSVNEYDLNGTYLKTIYGPDKKFVSVGMCVTDEQNLAVCEVRDDDDDDVKSCIKIFNKQDHLPRDICRIKQDGSPSYITYNNGKYFVSYVNKNYIGVFDKHGVFLYTFGEEGEMDGQFDGVTGLAAYGPDMILVCDADNKRVQLIATDGQFVRSFGCGTEMIDGPMDVAVAADGKVFVVQVDGRVQIWR